MKIILKGLRNRWAVFLHDLLWIPCAVWLAFQLRFNFDMPVYYMGLITKVITFIVPVQAVLFWNFGLYRGQWRFASIPDLSRIFKAVMIGTILLATMVFITRLGGMPRTVIFLYPLLLGVGLSSARVFNRWWKDRRVGFAGLPGRRAVVVGAEQPGEGLIRELLRGTSYHPVGLVDDDPAKLGSEIHGVRVVGRSTELAAVIERLDVDMVFVAVPAPPRALMNRVVMACSAHKIPCQIAEFPNDPTTARLRDMRPVALEDLLGREPVHLDYSAITAYLADKRILVTGGGGSIGSELCRQVAAMKPARLTVLDVGEFNIYTIEQELRRSFPELDLEFVLGDVRDRERIHALVERVRPQVIFHAAAYKHVPIVELYPREGIVNNVFGTMAVADAARAAGCERFIMISTDKAINPTSVMGATKRIAEIYCQNLAERSSTGFITVRFGNVLGSAGSVVPLFTRQIAAGGPLTVTHPEVTRYFMTIPEAVALVLQAGAMGEGGEIFVLDMGQPVRISDLARQMIRLAGMEPGVEIQIEYIGLRPGEKLTEELFHDQESLKPTPHPKIMLAASRSVEWERLLRELKELERVSRTDSQEGVYGMIRQLVPEFVGGGERNAQLARERPEVVSAELPVSS